MGGNCTVTSALVLFEVIPRHIEYPVFFYYTSAPCAAEMSPRPSLPQSPQSIQLVLKGNILFCDVMEGVSSLVFSIEHLGPAATRQPVRDLTLGSARSYLSRVRMLKENFRLKCNPRWFVVSLSLDKSLSSRASARLLTP